MINDWTEIELTESPQALTASLNRDGSVAFIFEDAYGMGYSVISVELEQLSRLHIMAWTLKNWKGPIPS